MTAAGEGEREKETAAGVVGSHRASTAAAAFEELQ
jgi:hypothetical protein